MNLIQPYLSQANNQWDFSQYKQVSQQSTRVSSSQQQEKDMVILTEDGDRVTISSDHQSQTHYTCNTGFSMHKITAAYDNHTITGHGYSAFENEALKHDDTRFLSISIEGDLNDQEKADIRKLLKDIDQIMVDLLNNGDAEKGIAMALNLLEMESISGFSANYRYEDTVSIEQKWTDDVSMYSDNGLPGEIAPENNEHIEFFQHLIEEMIDSVKTSGIMPLKLIDPLKAMFSNIRHDLSENHQMNRPKIDLIRFAEEILIDRILHLK